MLLVGQQIDISRGHSYFPNVCALFIFHSFNPNPNQAVLAEIGANESVTKMMFLAICYSANVGGTGTLIGTSSTKFNFTFSMF